MRQIPVSTDVFSRIWALRHRGEESEDAILKRVLWENSTATAVEVSGTRRPAIQRQKGHWLEDLEHGLESIGGEGWLSQISKAVYEIRDSNERTLPDNFDATVRAMLQEYSSGSKRYKAGNPDRFVNVKRGFWALKARKPKPK